MFAVCSVLAALCSWENFLCLARLIFVLDCVVVGCSWCFAMNYLEFWAGAKEPDLCVLLSLHPFVLRFIGVQSMKDCSFSGILGQPSTGILFLWEISTVMGYWRAPSTSLSIGGYTPP